MSSAGLFIKISIVLAVATLGSFGGANIALAQTVDQTTLITQLQKQIQQLLTQIQTLQKEVTELKTETGIQASSVLPVSPISETEEVELPEFTRSLSLGTRGDDVRKLQEFLARDKEIYPEGLATGYYGPKTAEAVKRWQKKNNVEVVGIVGPKTIAKFRELGQGVVQGLIQQGTPSGVIPPGLMMAPGVQKQMATTTLPTMPYATMTPPILNLATTTTPAIPAVPAIPATPAQPTQTSATPATPAQPATAASNELKVIYPNGGETWYKNNSYTITWQNPLASGFTGQEKYYWNVLLKRGNTAWQADGGVPVTQSSYTWSKWTGWAEPIPDASDFKVGISLVDTCAAQVGGICPSANISIMPAGGIDYSDNYFMVTTTPSIITPTGDTTAPTISNTQASSITSSSVVITWTTNKPSDSVITFTTKSSCISGGLIITSGGAEWYDCTRSGVGGAASGNANTTNHQVTVSTLSPSTHYYYQAIFPGDQFGVGKVVGPVQTLDTLSAIASQPLPDLIIETTPSVTPSSQTTNQPATIGFRIKNWSSAATITNFSPTFTVESSPNSGDISASTYAEATIQNITRADCPINLGPYGSCYITFTIIYTAPGQKTFWIRVDPQNQIQEADENNNSIQSLSFNVIAPSTTDATPPTVTLAVGYPNVTTQNQPVYVGFNSNEETKVVYEYGLTTSYGSTLNVWDQYWTSNGIYLPALNAGASYHIRGKATDRAGNIGYSQDYTFTTTGSTSNSTVIPDNASAVTGYVSGQTVNLQWNDNSSNETSFNIYRRSSGLNVTPGAWTNIGQAAANPNTYTTTYYTDSPGAGTWEYRVDACNSAGCASNSGTVQLTVAASSSSTATTTAAVLDSLNGLLKKLMELLQK
ncbi:MAG: peptidoglycan-binding protein [Candidatus Sungbacteria bacterium]|uniref:Peptidoglycan-binding protein n=1 Tax=Candidatus Sungiibacteriota bacterium TaxID=2750080 RepID=A0A931YD68_9BACT|nr:peptidoglycan-binding protein [Candidatus Sungbacteria bacterium]